MKKRFYLLVSLLALSLAGSVVICLIGPQKSANALDPKKVIADNWYQRALTELENERYSNAKELLSRVLNLSPERGDARVGLGVVYFYKRDFEKAEAQFNLAKKNAPNDAKIWNNVGATYAYRHSWQKAIEAFEEALRLDKNNVWVAKNLCVAYRESNQLELFESCNENVKILEKRGFNKAPIDLLMLDDDDILYGADI